MRPSWYSWAPDLVRVKYLARCLVGKWGGGAAEREAHYLLLSSAPTWLHVMDLVLSASRGLLFPARVRQSVPVQIAAGLCEETTLYLS